MNRQHGELESEVKRLTYQSEEMYRSNLEAVYDFIIKKYGDNRKALNTKDVMEYLAIGRNSAREKYFKKGMTIVTVENFARIISKL